MNGKSVVMAFPGEGIGSHMFPADLSRFLNDYYRQKGVEVLAGDARYGLGTAPGQARAENPERQGDREVSRTPW